MERQAAAHQASIDEIDEELALYDPNGPWRFLRNHLEKLEARAQVALETGPLDNVPTERAKLSLIRDLLDRPKQIRQTRELLVGGIENE